MVIYCMKKKLQIKTIHTKSGEVILKEAEYWTQEAAAIEINTTPGNIRSHVHMHYLGTQVSRMNLLTEKDLDFIKTRLRKK